MVRTSFAVLAFALSAACGCGSSAPPPPPVAAPTTSAAAPAAQPETAAAPQKASPIQAAGPSATSAPPRPDDLRDLAARLIESDGVGWRTSEKAALELEKRGPAAIEQLWPLLGDSQVEVRRGAAYVLLGNFNPNRPDQVAALAGLLDDSDRTNRGIALSAVKQMLRVDQVAAVPRLATLLDPAREENPANRAALARLLAALKTDAAPATDELAHAAVADPDAGVRSACLVALAQVAPPEQALQALATGLEDAEPGVRLVAAARLKKIGAEAAAAAQELAAALDDNDVRVRENAADALIAIGSPAVQPLATALSSQNREARKLALACLAKLGPAAEPATAAIQKCLADSDPLVKQLAQKAIDSIRP